MIDRTKRGFSAAGIMTVLLTLVVFTGAGSAQTNIAPTGTGYVWHTLPSSTSKVNQNAATGINDGNLTTSVTAYPGGSESTSNQYEGGGVIFASAQSGITKVVFINGAITTGGDGYFESSIALQTYNGSSWSNVSGWSLSPSYPYTTAAGGVTYTYTGAALNNVLGVRIVGIVRATSPGWSWFWLVNEIQVFASAPLSNIAPGGTGYVWHTMPSSTGINNQSAATGINDGNLTTAVTAYPGGSESTSNQYEGGGVIFSGAQSGITKVVFINGTITSGGDGYFESSIALQTYNGTAWANVSGWSLSPSYPYTTAAGGVTYTYTGPALNNVLGVRLVGIVRATSPGWSWFWLVNEIQIFSANATPNFGVTATPSAQTVVQGSGAGYTATVTAVNGFNGTVNLSVSGLPTGTTGTFSPTSVTGGSGTSTLSVSSSASTPTGTYPLTISGTSGSLVNNTSVSLEVDPPPPPADFSLSATPSSQTVAQGSGTSYTATVNSVSGFNGTVGLSVSGLPTGAAGTFSPTSVTGGSGSSTLSITTSASTTTGTYPLTVTGVSGSLNHSSGVSLVVNSGTSYNQTILNDTPVAFWNMSGSGTTETDASGHSHTGTYQGPAHTLTTLPNGDQAALFNGSSNYLTVPSSSAFSIPTTGYLTFELWIKPTTLQFPNPANSDGYVDIMGKCADYSPTCEWESRMYSTTTAEGRPNRMSAYVFNPSAGLGSAADWQPVANLIQANHWYHIVGEYQTHTTPTGNGWACNSTYPGGINIWVDGVEWDMDAHFDTGCMSQYNVVPVANNSPLNIGTMATDAWFQGAIGKVAIYNYLLTPTQITNHYKSMTGANPTGSCASTCTF